MKIVLIIGLILGFFIIKGITKIGSQGFEIKGGKVYYYTPVAGVPFMFDRTEVKGADPASFKVIRFPFAKDANHVFRYSEILEGADIESFQLLDHEMFFSKDKNKVFFCYTVLSEDPENFVLLGNMFAKDRTSVYWKNGPIEGADPATFENLGHAYAKDKHRVFFEKNLKLNIVEDASPEHFKLDPNDPTKGIDGEKLFHEGVLVSQAKGSFQEIDDYYSKDEASVFYRMESLQNADPKTFKIINEYFSKDAHQVYHRSYVLENADPSTFKIMEEFFSHDGENLYHRSRTLEGGDFSTLEILNSRWAKDKNQVYLQGYLKEDLDPVTFHALKGAYVKDKNFVYHFETKVRGADATSFKTEGEYPDVKATDKNHRYVGHSAVDKNGKVLN